MAALTIGALNNGAVDLETISKVANSLDSHVTDRMGNPKLTLRGAIDSLKQFRVRGNFIVGEDYETKDLYSTAGKTYVVILDHKSTGVEADLLAGKIALYQGVVFQQDGTGSVLRTVDDKLKEHHSVLDKGARGDGVTGDLSAVLASRASSDYLYFPRVNDKITTYYIDAYSAGALDGAYIDVAPGVTLSLAASTYSLTRNINFLRDTRVIFRDVPAGTIFPKTPIRYKRESMAVPVTAHERKRTALDCTQALEVIGRSNAWPISDVFPSIDTNNTADTMSFPASAEGFKGSFINLGPYETVAATFPDGISRGPMGVIITGADGFTAIFCSGGQANYVAATKIRGQPVQNNGAMLSWDFLGQGLYTSFNAENAMFSITRVSSNEAIIKLNGKFLVKAPYVGVINEVAFVRYTALAFSIYGFTIERRTDAIVGNQAIGEIRIFGDSTAEEMPGSWSTYLKPLLDSVFGVKVGVIINRAVSGTDIGYVYDDMLANGLGNAYFILICTGTNNAQGNTPIAQYNAKLLQVLTLVKSQKRQAILMPSWMWYPKNLAGGIGQDSVNYEKCAPYRMSMKRLGAEMGAIVLDTTEELPNPDPRLLITDPGAALLRDDIHQDQYAHQLYAQMVAQGLVDSYLSLPESIEFTPPQEWFLNGASNAGDLRFTIDKSGMASLGFGTFRVTTIANNTAILRLPRWMRLTRSGNMPAQALPTGAGSILGGCYLNYDQATSELRLLLVPAGTGLITLGSTPYKTA